ncbi:MAG: hypothetical protein J6S10_02395 [Clostridia bacterium]|nr:hypothetical protein [Clostridia bacterium]
MKILKLLGKIALFILPSLLSLLIVLLGVLNVAKFVIYSDYYSHRDNLCKNPGLSDGFVCQGICIDDASEQILVSGYMKDGSASRIYITTLDSESHYVILTKGGEPFDGHCGGISTANGIAYLADGDHIYPLSLNAILNAKGGESVEVGEGVKVNNAASFCYADENYLYVGEFHDGGKYVTDHPYDTAEGTHYAIVSRYTHDDLEHPDKVYSIRDKVQGICFTPDGEVVMSTSYGLKDSVYYVYDESAAKDSGLTLDGAPLYYLDNCEKEIKGPAMAEGLDFYGEKIITLTESASDKYIFGKFFFANKIIELDIK